MAQKDDCLGLSLSLRSPQERPPPETRFPFNLFVHKISTAGVIRTDFNGELRSYLGGIDVNRALTVTESDDAAQITVTSPNSTVSSVSGKRNEREEIDGEKGSSSLEMDGDGGDAAARKKLRLTKEQAAVLEETFKENYTLNTKQKMGLAKHLNLRPRQVEVWFQNRRARTKLKQTEVDCEYLRRCCDNLTDQNRRLEKEVNDLRAVKLSPQFYMNLNPPTTLTMCPQCERVPAGSSPAATGPSANPGLPSHQLPLGLQSSRPRS